MKQMVKVSQNHGWTECPPNDNCGPANGSSVVWVTETEEVVSMDTEPAFTGRLDGQIKVPGSIDGVSTFIDQNAHLQPAGATVCQWTLKKIADGRAPASGCAYFEVLNVAHPASGIVGPEDINVDGGSSISTQPPMWPPGNERANARWLIPIDANGNPLTQKYFKVSNQKFTDHAMIAPHNKDSDGGEYVYFQKPSSSNPTTGEDYEFWLLVPA